jgi:hypothetical protein
MPLMPEPIVHRDGTDKNDGERNTAKRFVIKLRHAPPHLTCIVTADSLSANAPHIETLQHDDLRYSLGVKEGDHAFLFRQVQAAEHAGRVTYDARHDRAAGVMHRFRFVHAGPLNASHGAGRVHCIESWEIRDAKGQHCSWVTDRRVSKRNVLHLMRGGRARWKIANATFHTLQNQGYNFAHNYGHGEQHLSVVFAMLLLAFVVDQAQQLCCAWFRAVWLKLGRKRLLWERMRALFSTYALTSMRQLFAALMYGFKRSSPLVTIDATSCPLHLFGSRVSACGKASLSRENSAQRMTACPPAQAILLDRVAGRPAVKHHGGPNGQKTVDAETLSGNCCFGT